MAIAWFLCPYDSSLDLRPKRQCAMMRYIPTIPNAAGDVWDEIEILDGMALVEVSVSATMLATITADVDFIALPSSGIIPAGIITKLLALGYTVADLPSVPTVANLFPAITKFRSAISLSGSTIVLGGRIVAAKDLASIQVSG